MVNNFDNIDLEKETTITTRIVEALIAIQQAVVDAKPKIADWKFFIDTLTSKFILHTSSIAVLAKGTKLELEFQNRKISLIDTPMLVILRAQLECFLMFNFIYYLPNTDQEKEFRYWVWKYDNLLMRLNIPIRAKEIKKQQEEDRIEMEQLKEKILASPYFMKYSKDQRKIIIKRGDSKLFNSWDKLILTSGLNSLFTGLYPILSSFAHTGAHSLMNLKDQKLGYTKYHNAGYIYLFLSRLLLATYIMRFKELFTASEIKFNLLPIETKTEIELYYKFATTKKQPST